MKSPSIVEDWILDASNGELFRSLRETVDYLSIHLFNEFEPTPYGTFDDRLDRWLKNVDSESDKKLLYQMVTRLFFIGRKEFDALYRHAYQTIFFNWIAETCLNNFRIPSAESLLEKANKQTWFCPITDSMRISGFYHSNKISGRELRPDWKSLAKLGDKKLIKAYIKSESITRIVLLEDFVGSGTQMRDAAAFAASLSNGNLPVLVTPLLCCPEGLALGKRLEEEYKNLTFRPAVTLPEAAFVRTYTTVGECDLAADIRRLVHQSCKAVQGRDITSGSCPAFGFKGLGALVVMYSNCPNNSLPLLHRASNTWSALFPRTARL